MATLVGTLTIPREAAYAGPARHEVQRLAEKVVGYAADPDHMNVAEDIALAVGEFLANSIQHGAGNTTGIRVLEVGVHIRVEVSDAYTGDIQAANEDPLGETGRGLLLVRCVADAWGFEQDDSGTTAWFVKAVGR